MPAARDVAPLRWADITVLFDDGRYSVIIGLFDHKLSLGQRWNGQEGELGYPSLGANPVWYVTPDFLVLPVLHGLLDDLAESDRPGRDDMMRNVTAAMRRWCAS